jgi:hypothetical protein
MLTENSKTLSWKVALSNLQWIVNANYTKN